MLLSIVGLALAVLVVPYGLRAARKYASLFYDWKARGQMQDERWVEAYESINRAWSFRPGDPGVLKTSARFYSKILPTQGVLAWREYFKKGSGTPEERLEYAEVALRVGRSDLAAPFMSEIMSRKPPTARVLLLATRFYALQEDSSSALRFAKEALKLESTNQVGQLTVASLLVVSPLPKEREEASQILWGFIEKTNVFQGKTNLYQVPAMQMLVNKTNITTAELQRLELMLTNRKSTNIGEIFFLQDVKMRLNPAIREKSIDNLIRAHKDGSLEEKRALAAWLNSWKEYKLLLKVIPPPVAQQDMTLLSFRLQALESTQSWAEMETLLASEERVLDPLYLLCMNAIVAAKLNKPDLSEIYWRQAYQSSENDVRKMEYLGGLAQRSRNIPKAIQAFERMSQMPEGRVDAYRHLSSVLEDTEDIGPIRDVFQKLAKEVPDEPVMASSALYYNFLLKEKVASSLEAAEALHKKFPEQLSARVTLALAYLRTNQGVKAMPLFTDDTQVWELAKPAWKGIYAASLAAGGKSKEALAVAKSIPKERLKKSEIELIGEYVRGF